jgi:hypothetical protein
MLGREVIEVEFNPGGTGTVPHDPASEREHERDLREMAERDRVGAEAERAMHGRRRWWAFWRRTKR